MATSPSLHALLLLSDSALPLGSFAFSSGLESFLAHRKQSLASLPTTHADQSTTSNFEAFTAFLSHSLRNLASTALPYVLAAHSPSSSLDSDAEKPEEGYLDLLRDLDNTFDASTPCTVSRRASVSQGRALLAIWTRALSSSTPSLAAAKALSAFATTMNAKQSYLPAWEQVNAHFPPLFGAVASALSLTREETAYLFLLSHAKAVLSAGVRASVMGPYQSQGVLASLGLQDELRKLVREFEGVAVGEAAVSVPSVELWMGRHELLYSRIFNS
jgi:urease accessory protein